MTLLTEHELPDVPVELVDAGAAHHLVVLVGAGASLAAGLPNWDALLSELLKRALHKESDPGKKAALSEVAAEWQEPTNGWTPLEKGSLLGHALGPIPLQEAIAEQFRRKPESSPTPTHEALAALSPGTAYITTNYDQLLEAALEASAGKLARKALQHGCDLTPGIGAVEEIAKV